MSKGKKRDPSKERFWRRLLAQHAKSNVSARTFCQRHGLSEANFYAWRRILGERDAQAVRFVRVTLVPDEKPGSAASVNSSIHPLELILFGGRFLRIGTGFDGPTLQRLLALLEEGRPCC